MKQRTISKLVAIVMCLWLIGTIGMTCVLAVNQVKAGKENDTAKKEIVCAFFIDTPLDIDIIEYIQQLCCDYEIPFEIVLSVIETESSYNPEAVSRVGAIGLMQIMPQYHQERMRRLNCNDLMNPKDNITVGVDFLSELLKLYEGDMHKALTAYCFGVKGANERLFSKGVKCSDYSQKVLKTAQRISDDITVVYEDTES